MSARSALSDPGWSSGDKAMLGIWHRVFQQRQTFHDTQLRFGPSLEPFSPRLAPHLIASRGTRSNLTALPPWQIQGNPRSDAPPAPSLPNSSPTVRLGCATHSTAAVGQRNSEFELPWVQPISRSRRATLLISTLTRRHLRPAVSSLPESAGHKVGRRSVGSRAVAEAQKIRRECCTSVQRCQPSCRRGRP
jgi:hypothetical protein